MQCRGYRTQSLEELAIASPWQAWGLQTSLWHFFLPAVWQMPWWLWNSHFESKLSDSLSLLLGFVSKLPADMLCFLSQATSCFTSVNVLSPTNFIVLNLCVMISVKHGWLTVIFCERFEYEYTCDPPLNTWNVASSSCCPHSVSSSWHAVHLWLYVPAYNQASWFYFYLILPANLK